MPRAGGLVAFPTETVYGLGADATNAAAIARLYQAKGRPAFNPLIAHVGDIGGGDADCPLRRDRDGACRGLLAGPADAGAAEDNRLHGGRSRHRRASIPIAIRVPAHPVARQILRAFGGPVVAPSANLSGHVSPTTAAHVQTDLAGRIDLIVDGGPVEVGVESTIVGCFDAPMLLRPGGLPRGEIERVLGRPLGQPPEDAHGEAAQPLAPGMLASHYAPRTKVRLDAASIEPGEALLAFGSHAAPGVDAATAVMNLSAHGDLDEAAANLFGYLRALDARGARAIAVMPVPHHGLGEAINDRLRRAAVERD